MSPRTMIGQHDDRAFYGFLHWRFAYAGPAPVYAAPPSWGRHPQTFTFSTELGCPRDGQFTPNRDRAADVADRQLRADKQTSRSCRMQARE